MIVRMSKVEIAGPRALLQDVLSLLQEKGLLQIEPNTIGFIREKDRAYIESFLSDKETLTERFYLEELKVKIEELFSYLKDRTLKKSYIQPRAIIDTINETLQKHLLKCRELHHKKEKLQEELAELNHHRTFLEAIEPLLERLKHAPDTDLIGITLRAPEAKKILRELLMQQTEGDFEFLTTTASDGTIVGLIAISKRASEDIKNLLGDKGIPEFVFPASLDRLTFMEKISFIENRTTGIFTEIDEINMQLDSLTIKWGAIYKRVKEWVDERLSVLKAASSVFETGMCFFIYGWMASEGLKELRESLNHDFAGKVILEEMEIHEEDLDRIPVVLKNLTYFKPFELLTRILPLPRYTSYDPTLFIGIFFPLFFGMILGDAGYGLILLIISLVMIAYFRAKRDIQDAAKILSVGAMYSIFFGILYGEFFGELGYMLFGIEPIFLERRTAVIPMLYFAVTVGVVHLGIGSLMGFIIALKKKTKKEIFSKFFQILFMLSILSLVGSLFGLFPMLLTKPIILAILFLTPFILFTGGLLAPLELIKGIGNIISYVRIMAIGLTSVLLALVANHLAGMSGNIVIGVVVAGLLHLLNLIIGVFSPAIHSLRLHYVEFFSKFIESGGRRFEPLKKSEPR